MSTPINSIPPLPNSCPFTIRRLNSTTHLVRENDKYGEYPNIFVKTIRINHPVYDCIFVLSDTGCGTQVDNESYDPKDTSAGPKAWNISTFLDFTLDNKSGQQPYLIISTHCHFDHILGLEHLLLPESSPHNQPGQPSDTLLLPSSRHHSRRRREPRPISVLTSSHQPSFTTPYANLQEHSICAALSLHAPHYTTTCWARHGERVHLPLAHPSHATLIVDTGITILHTPGHTPDSLAWFDGEEAHLSVGDTFYARESGDTRDPGGAGGDGDGSGGEGGARRWEREPPMPTIFCRESDLGEWWRSIGTMIEFVLGQEIDVREEQERTNDGPDGAGAVDERAERVMVVSKRKRVTLSAAHVTSSTPALNALHAIRAFVARILRDEVPFAELETNRGERTGLWDDALSEATEAQEVGEDDGELGKELTFSVKAPLRIIEEGRRKIPRKEWEAA